MFLPSAGKVIENFSCSRSPFVRNDGMLKKGYRIPVYYDSLILKLISWGTDRREAIERMAAALNETRIEGPATNISFLKDILLNAGFRAGKTDISFIQNEILKK